MADKEIGDYPVASTLDGTELLELVQGGNSRQVPASKIMRVGQFVYTQARTLATGTTQIPLDDTIPQNTEGTEFMSLAITPLNAASLLMIEAHLFLSYSAEPAWVAAALFQDSAPLAIASMARRHPEAHEADMYVFRHLMTAGTTSVTTFKVRAGANIAGTLTFNGLNSSRRYGGTIASGITITEVLP